MKRTTKIIGSFTLFLAMTSSAWAYTSIPAHRIREQFWKSNDGTLQLAAEALGDDGLVNLYQELLKKKDATPEVQKALEQLKK